MTTGLVKAGTVESKIILEVGDFYIYKSVTAYDRKNDLIDYVINSKKGDTLDRFASLESAVNSFNSILAYYSNK
jgi:hypothetical protein